MNKVANTTYPIHDVLAQRWSPRAFRDQAVPTETLLSLLEAARWAPSSRNEQPWRFIVATKDDPEMYGRLFDALMEGNQRWAKDAPVLMLGVAALNWSHNDKPNKYARYDLGQAIAHLTVEATAQGLHVHQMGGFSSERARDHFDIPEGYEPVVALAIGYAGVASDLPDDLEERERQQRVRKPLEELILEAGFPREERLKRTA